MVFAVWQDDLFEPHFAATVLHDLIEGDDISLTIHFECRGEFDRYCIAEQLYCEMLGL